MIQYPSNPPKAEPNLMALLVWGLGAGLLLGTLAAALMRLPKLTLQLAAFAFAGCALAGAASFLFSAQYTSSVVMRLTPPIDPKRWYAKEAAMVQAVVRALVTASPP